MDQYSSNDIDQTLVDKIVCEVKSHGLFDQFRRECMADVDTKPAYQNLQHRVETTVNNFLKEQKWTPELNKNQLREKLRKFVTEKGFLDTGVERIVDQVVNPKINSNFLPKIEDVSYKFMGIQKPMKKPQQLELPPMEPAMGFLPNLDLEQVSPESEKSPSIPSKSPKYEPMDESNDKMEDFESPAFEPLESYSGKTVEENCEEIKTEIVYDDPEKSNDDDDDKKNIATQNSDEIKSNLSSISGLTSNESLSEAMDDDADDSDKKPIVHEKMDETDSLNHDSLPKTEDSALNRSQDPTEPSTADVKSEAVDTVRLEPEIKEEKKENNSVEVMLQPQEVSRELGEVQPASSIFVTSNSDLALDNMNNDSELSQVSSSSRLSIVTNNNTNTRMDDGEGETNEALTTKNNEDGHSFTTRDICPYGYSEEAQMQKFNDSSSENSLVINENTSESNCQNGNKELLVTSFDIKKEEIKFEGTERKSFDFDLNIKKSMDESDAIDQIRNVIDQKAYQNSDYEMNYKMESNGTNELERDASNTVVPRSKPDTIDSNTSEKSVFKSKENSSNGNRIDVKNSRGTADAQPNEKTKSRDKDRSSSSHHSKDRSRSNSDRDKDRSRNRDRDKSHSSSKDRSKSSRDGSQDNDLNRKKDSSSSSAKHKNDDKRSNHKGSSSKSTSSSTHSLSSRKDRDHHRDRDRSKSERSNTSSSTSKRDSHVSSSSSHSKDRHRSDLKKPSTSSTSKKDDHYLYKEKSSSRQRSRSKDSNDGSANYSGGSRNSLPGSHEGNSQPVNNQSSTKSQPEPEQMKTAAATISASEEVRMEVSEISSVDAHNEIVLVTTAVEEIVTRGIISPYPSALIGESDKDFVLSTKPVVVDQILTGTELNLEMFIGENRNDPLVSSIERSLSTQVRKPKCADNIHEVRKLAKVRKQIDREEQKKIEQAKVLAKQYIRTNSGIVKDDDQGVEIEFACVETESGTKRPGPTISSPLKYINGREIDEHQMYMSRDSRSPALDILGEGKVLVSTNTAIICDYIPGMEVDVHVAEDKDDFHGFDERSRSEARMKLQQVVSFVEIEVNKQSSSSGDSKLMKKAVIELLPLDIKYKKKNGQYKEAYNLSDIPGGENHKLFFENNKINDERELLKKQSMILNRKRKHGVQMSGSSHSDTNEIEANEISKVFVKQASDGPDDINSTSVDSTVKLNNNTVSSKPKHSNKTRYSPDDLFKPRPVCGGGSRSRRRGINCND